MYYISSSEFGGCVKVLTVQESSGIKPGIPDYLLRAAEEGNMHEPMIRSKMQPDYGLRPADPNGAGLCTVCKDKRNVEREGYHVEFELIAGKLTVIGHADDILYDSNNIAYVGEYKALGKTSFQRLLPDLSNYRKYGYQVSLYHYGLGQLPIFYARKNRDSGRIDADFFPGPPFTIEQIHKRAFSILHALETGEVPSCDVLDKDLMDNWGCMDFCKPDKDKRVADPNIQVSGSIANAIKSYREAVKLLDSGAILKKTSERILMDELVRVGKTKHSVNGLAFQRVEQSNWNYNYDPEQEEEKDKLTNRLKELKLDSRSETTPTTYAKIVDTIKKEG